MKNLVILGSTGSIGTQTLEVVRAHPEDFKVVGISAHENAELFERQTREFEPRHTLLTSMSENPDAALAALAALPDADIVVNAVSGSAGLGPTLAAVKAGKRLALANKESIVMAGELITKTVSETGAQILPIDSEPSAIWQMIHGHHEPAACLPSGMALGSAAIDGLEKIILTASGGPFWKWHREELMKVSAEQALKHPTWKMGGKVSIDSATLMNKAFEIIETRWLFGVTPEKIDVSVHRQSIVHALVQWSDGNTTAVLSQPDMKIPIAHALFFPVRSKPEPCIKQLDFTQLQLTFEKPDYSVFEGPRLAYEVLQAGGIMPAVFCLADEIAVSKFLRGEISFLGIYDFIKGALDRVKNAPFSLEMIDILRKSLTHNL